MRSGTPAGAVRTHARRRLAVLSTGLVTLVCAGLAIMVCLSAVRTREQIDRSESPPLLWRSADGPVTVATASSSVLPRDVTAARRLALNPYDLQALKALSVQAADAGDRTTLVRRVAQMARLSRRDTAAELWRMREGLASGDHDMAFRSMDLLLRRNATARSWLVFEIASVLNQPAARQALISRLAASPVWRAGFISNLASSAPISAADALFLEMAAAKLQIGDREFEPLLRRHLAIKDYNGARRMWAALYPIGDQNSLVYDGGFRGLPGPPPFNWQVITDTEGAVEWKPTDGRPGGQLSVRHDLYSSSQPLIGQFVFLPAGVMQISIRARAVEGVSNDRFRLELVCFGGPVFFSQRIRVLGAGWTTTTEQFARPERDCEAQVLRLAPVTADRSQSVQVVFDDLQVRPVRGIVLAGSADQK
jgi:hypothetical protein